MMPLTLWEIAARAVIAVAAIAFLVLCLNWARHPGRRVAPKAGIHAKKIKTMDLILILVGVTLLIFTITMIVLFVRTGTEPSTLETCVFAALAGECGVMGWIKTTKQRYQDREWQRGDKEAAEPEKPPDEEFPTNDL